MVNFIVKSVVFCIVVFLSSFSFSQDKITGAVKDEAGVIEFCAVRIYKNADSLLIQSVITDENGKFEFINVQQGAYQIHIRLENYELFVSPEITYIGGVLELNDYILTTKTIQATEVSVVARKPILTVTAEKTVLNVGNITNMTGVNALEVLRRTPGVMIDKDNGISLKGKNDVRIFLDGRPTQMTNEDLANMLRGMMASDIESIEVITNPSAKYDATGTGGIINIVLKKNKGFGNNVTLDGGLIYSESLKYTGSVSFNHRDKRFNVFANYGTNGGSWQDYMNLYRIQSGYIYDQETKNIRKDLNNNFKIGTDYFINKKHILGVNVTGNSSNGSWNTNSRTPIYQEGSDQVEQVLVAQNTGPREMLNLNFNANYRFADTLGTKFTTDLDYGMFSKKQNSYQPNFYMNTDESIIEQQNIYRNNTPTDIRIMTIKSDYERKINELLVSTGYKIANVETDNTFDFYNEINSNALIDSTRSNTFHYTENVAALYLNFNRKIKKFSIQAGVRYEYTHSIGRLESLISNPTPVDRKYGNFFPSAALTYDVNKKHTLTLTYSNRIDRPNYQDLNPFENKLDELTYQKGNAFLNPQYSNSFELSHVFMEFLTSSVGFTRTNDFMTEILDTLNGNASYLTQTNLDYMDSYTFNIGAPIPIQKWLFSFLNFSLYRNEYRAQFDDGKIVDVSNMAFNIYLSNSFKLPKNWSIELSGWYNSPTIMLATFLGKRMYSIDLGIKKKILDGKGDLKLNVSDIFRSQIWAGESNYAGFYMNATGGYESRQVRLNFTYRFGNSAVKSEGHKTGSEEEKSRIKAK